MVNDPNETPLAEQPAPWERCDSVIANHAKWTPKHLRDELDAIRQDISERKCPRDPSTISATVRSLRSVRSDIDARSKKVKAWVTVVGLSVLAAVFTAFNQTLGAALKDGWPFKWYILGAFAVEFVFMALALWFLALAYNVFGLQGEDEQSVKDLERLVDQLERHIDYDHDWMPNDAGVFIKDRRGSPKDMAMIDGWIARMEALPPTLASMDNGRIKSIYDEILSKLNPAEATDEYKAKLSTAWERIQWIDARWRVQRDEEQRSEKEEFKRLRDAIARERGAFRDATAEVPTTPLTNVRADPSSNAPVQSGAPVDEALSQPTGPKHNGGRVG